MLRAMPRLVRNSSKRRRPRSASRMISMVQRSPMTSSVRAIEQFWPSYSRPSMWTTLPKPVASRNSNVLASGCVMRLGLPEYQMARRWKVLLVTSVAVFMALLDVTIVNIVFAAALIPAGRLADRFGRRRFFLAGISVFLLASLACALAGSVGVLVAARIVQALGGAVLMPTSLSLVLPEFPAEKRATATALWTATGAVAAATGPSLGGVLVNWQGWRAVFFVNLLFGLPMLIPARRLLRESRDTSVGRWPDGIGAALLALG